MHCYWKRREKSLVEKADSPRNAIIDSDYSGENTLITWSEIWPQKSKQFDFSNGTNLGYSPIHVDFPLFLSKSILSKYLSECHLLEI